MGDTLYHKAPPVKPFSLRLNAQPLPAVNPLVLKLFTNSTDALPWPGVKADTAAWVSQTRCRRLGRVACALGCWGLLLGSIPAAVAGEKITITGSTNQIELPKEPAKIFAPPGGELFRSRVTTPGESSLGPVVPPPGQPSLMRNPKLDELIDKKKNWIFESPNSLDRDKAIKDIFGVREYDLDQFNKRPKTVLERQFENNPTSDKDRASSRPDRLGKDSPAGERLNGRNEWDPTDRYGGADRLQDRGIIPELNPAYLFNPTMVPDPFTQIGGSLGRSTVLPQGLGDANALKRTPTQTTTQPVQPERNLDRFWESYKNPWGRFSDPINDPSDATRSVMNPIAARKPSVPAPSSTQPTVAGSYSSSYPPTAPTTTRPDLFNPSQSRLPTGPAYPIPAANPSPTPAFQPKPAVLEIPRPKF